MDQVFVINRFLVFEVTHASAYHSHATFVSLLDRIFIANATTRLYNSCYTILSSQCYGIIEWEETV